jgi:thiamine transport system ATP-binding protein
MLDLNKVEIHQGTFTLQADFALPASGIIAIIGPSGGGKSTLLAAIAGFLPLASGAIHWQGQDWASLPTAQRPVAQLFQDQNLFPHLSITRNLALGFTHKFRLIPAQKSRIEDMLSQVGLAGMGARKPAQLSGGQQSRAALARAFLQDRPILLLDEPFAALGPGLRKDMLDLMAEQARARGQLVLMVTHDPADAARVADQIITVAQGRAAPPRPAQALLDDPDPELAAYLGQTSAST